MFSFRMPRVNIGHALSQFNPMSMVGHINMGNPMHTVQDAFGAAKNMSPLTQAFGMTQRHPMDGNQMRQMIGKGMGQQQPMAQPLQPPMPPPIPQPSQPPMSPPMPQMMNPNMGANPGMTPMGTPIGRGRMPAPAAGRGLSGAMNALNAQRPSNAFTDPNQQKMQKMQNMAQMFGIRK